MFFMFFSPATDYKKDKKQTVCQGKTDRLTN